MVDLDELGLSNLDEIVDGSDPLPEYLLRAALYGSIFGRLTSGDSSRLLDCRFSPFLEDPGCGPLYLMSPGRYLCSFFGIH